MQKNVAKRFWTVAGSTDGNGFNFNRDEPLLAFFATAQVHYLPLGRRCLLVRHNFGTVSYKEKRLFEHCKFCATL